MSVESRTNTLHHEISKKDRNAQVYELINLGVDVDALVDGKTALHKAVESNNFSVLGTLYSEGPSFEITDNNGLTPLARAVTISSDGIDSSLTGDNQIVESLIERMIVENANLSLYSGEGLSPMLIASKYGNTQIIDLLVEADDSTVNDVDSFGRNGVHLAAMQNHPTVIYQLVKLGARKNQRDNYGESPLILAVKSTQNEAKNKGFESFHVLLLSNVDIRIPDTKHGWTALHYAVYLGQKYIIDQLVKKDNSVLELRTVRGGWTPLHIAVMKNDNNIIRFMIKHGSNVNAKTSNNQNVFHLAAGKNNTGILADFVELNVNINLLDDTKQTPIHIAASKKLFRMSNQLEEYGADVTVLGFPSPEIIES